MKPIPYGITIENVITDIGRYVKDSPPLPFPHYSGYEVIEFKRLIDVDRGYLILGFNGEKWALPIMDNSLLLWGCFILFKRFTKLKC